MEERLLSEDDEELYGLKLKTDPFENDDGEKLEAKSDDWFVQEAQDEESGEEEVEFEFPEATEDDESLVNLTPEEARELVRKREEEERAAQERFAALVAEGEGALATKDYEKARDCFTQANEIQPDDFALNVGYMRAYSEDFTALDDVEVLREVYDQCVNSCGEEFRQRIRTDFDGVLRTVLNENEKTSAKIHEEYDKKQAERRHGYDVRVKKAGAGAIWTGAVCLLSGVAAFILLLFVNSVPGSEIAIAAAICGVVAALFFIPLLAFVKSYANARRLQQENETEESTADGRKLKQLRELKEFLQEVLA